MSLAYYNEIDPAAAQWLRELIKAGLIAPGEVDERSIEDVIPSELVGFKQCHFFAGIGVWSHALRLAGWPDDRPVWTGSCPCQPFSAAGKGGGTSDERHLWPAFFWLIRQCRPNVVFGEQVEAALRHDWLDHVALDLEDCGYAVGAVSTPACGYGAPHIRQRLYWVAVNQEYRRREGFTDIRGISKGNKTPRSEQRIRHNSPARFVADAEGPGREGRDCGIKGNQKAERNERWVQQFSGGRNAGILGDSCGEGLQEQRSKRGISRGQVGAVQGQAVERTGAPTNGFWSDCEWIPCRDGKARPTEPGTFPLAHGAPARVGRLRGYGNAIVAPQAAAFIRAYMETI